MMMMMSKMMISTPPSPILSMRNTFNNLLMVLACLDSVFLILAMLDYSIARGQHHNCPPLLITITITVIVTVIIIIIILGSSSAPFAVFEWPFSYTGEFYALLFPKLLHPLTTTVVTCQTYLIVVIAFER